MDQDDTSRVTEIVSRVLELLSINNALQGERSESGFSFMIECVRPELLIGVHGQTLNSLEHLINTITRQQGITGRVALDVDGYRQKREEKVRAMVARLAQKVRSTGASEIVRPMAAAERRLAHLLIATEFPDLVSESMGEEPNRTIIVRRR